MPELIQRSASAFFSSGRFFGASEKGELFKNGLFQTNYYLACCLFQRLYLSGCEMTEPVSVLHLLLGSYQQQSPT